MFTEENLTRDDTEDSMSYLLQTTSGINCFLEQARGVEEPDKTLTLMLRNLPPIGGL
jgi:hypothetical protein